MYSWDKKEMSFSLKHWETLINQKQKKPLYVL